MSVHTNVDETGRLSKRLHTLSAIVKIFVYFLPSRPFVFFLEFIVINDIVSVYLFVSAV